ncbi:hypothetical protein DYB37_004760 [Aphanomyces astaci]|uniref:Uncharacterized protein n=1 Tax=Aphanomyces astaci TaxID=112090 RepID=A0A418DUX6_APHAT|nr:hypothetical protein DYB35_012035 [Aphanomyces astaci]RHZ34788.1 hypothetical protein DYB37_004760 [Aphanomyces astaci]
MTKSWNPEHVLPYHDAVVQVLHTCLQSLGYVTRWYGGHALCALYAFQLEHQTEPVPVDSYQAGLTELNIHEITSHFPWSILALDLQRRSTLAPSDSISTAHTTDLSESESSSESYDTNYSPLGMSPTLKPPGAMLSTFLDQISDQHAWTATQAALAADATLRDQHPPLLHAARLRAETLNATVKHNRRTPHDE